MNSYLTRSRVTEKRKCGLEPLMNRDGLEQPIIGRH
jgi:hypothetical protein